MHDQNRGSDANRFSLTQDIRWTLACLLLCLVLIVSQLSIQKVFKICKAADAGVDGIVHWKHDAPLTDSIYCNVRK